MQLPGRFITVEGVDGAGKSTQIEVIAQTIRQRGIELVTTREPGGTELAEKIRELLLHEPMQANTELLLMFASRQENLKNVIYPALQAGKWVLCDRFTDASYAYQAFGHNVSLKVVKALEEIVHPGFKPDRTVLFDLPPELAAARLQGKRDRFESEDKAFHKRVREGYLTLAKQDPQRFYIVDSSQDVATISDQLRKEFTTWL